MNINKTPFSVLMSVYHKEQPEYLDLCLKSLADQTLQPTEITLVLDGPIGDDLHAVISKWVEQELPIQRVPLETNKGLGVALAIGVEACSHELILRMDTDDICEPDRFEQQLKFMQDNPDITIVGSWIAEFDQDEDDIYGYRRPPIDHASMVNYMRKRNPLNHMTVAYRKTPILEVGNYQTFDGFEDYYLWARLVAAGYKLANIPEYLVKARAGSAVAGRRGGWHYIKAELAFYNRLRKMGITNISGFTLIIMMRIFVRIMPPKIRNFIYTKALRANL